MGTDIIQSDIGLISVYLEDDIVKKLAFVSEENINEQHQTNDNEYLRGIVDFVNGKTKALSVPYHLHGTSFQLKVWHEIAKIPYGETATYQDIARRIGHPKACRAVGMACGKNPLPLIIPCHRVIHSDGRIGDYIGGNELKRRLLSRERNH